MAEIDSYVYLNKMNNIQYLRSVVIFHIYVLYVYVYICLYNINTANTVRLQITFSFGYPCMCKNCFNVPRQGRDHIG